MPNVSNKTQRPLSVPLPRGKCLHLGPGKTGEIASNGLEHPQLKKLVDAGEIEIVNEGPRLIDRIETARKDGRGWATRRESVVAAAATADGARRTRAARIPWGVPGCAGTGGPRFGFYLPNALSE